MTMLDGGKEPVVARTAAIEWPTVALAVGIYGGWGALTFFHDSVPIWLLVPLGAWLVAWHGSLQHEVMHGHPTRSRAMNTLIGSVPLALWLPFERYRQTHLAHHCDERLTDPLDDPESWYWMEADWQRLGAVGRALVRAQATLPGRMLIGPAWSIGRFWREEALAIGRGDGARARIWAIHVGLSALVVAWVVLVAGMPLWLYVAAFVYPGTSLLLIRSFAEHRAHQSTNRRTAIVERAPLLGLLFLNNNLHAVHHRWPTLPWYTLPGFYARHRHAIVATGDGGPIYRGYGDVWRRFWRVPHDVAVHPVAGGDKPSPLKS
jgi:fatty acid desaturase